MMKTMNNEFWQVRLGGSVAACLPQPAFLAFTGWGEFPRLEKQQIDNR
jgi:hypothetical protein